MKNNIKAVDVVVLNIEAENNNLVLSDVFENTKGIRRVKGKVVGI